MWSSECMQRDLVDIYQMVELIWLWRKEALHCQYNINEYQPPLFTSLILNMTFVNVTLLPFPVSQQWKGYKSWWLVIYLPRIIFKRIWTLITYWHCDYQTRLNNSTCCTWEYLEPRCMPEEFLNLWCRHILTRSSADYHQSIPVKKCKLQMLAIKFYFEGKCISLTF